MNNRYLSLAVAVLAFVPWWVRAADPVPAGNLSTNLATGALIPPKGAGSISLADPAFGGTLPAARLPGNVQAAGAFAYRNYPLEASAAVNTAIAGKTPSTATQNFFSVYDQVNKVFTRNPTCVFSWPSYVSCWNSANADGAGGNHGCVTMISATQGVTNHHFGQIYAAGVVHYFLGTDGENYPLTVASSVQIGATDIQLVTFSAAAPAAVGVASVLAPGVPATVLPAGTPLLATNAAKQAIITQFLAVTDGDVYVNSATGSLAAWTQNPPGISGDSDSPTFVLLDGQFILLFTYYSGGGGPSLADNLAAINAALAPGTSLSALPLNTLGTAALLNTGTTAGTVPVLNANNQIDPGLLPASAAGGITYVEQVWDGTANVAVNPATTVLRLTNGTPGAQHTITLPTAPGQGQTLEIVVPPSTGTPATDPVTGGAVQFKVTPANLSIPLDPTYTRVFRLIAGSGGWAIDESLVRQNTSASFVTLSTPAADFTGNVVFETGTTIHGSQGTSFGFSLMGINGAAQFAPVTLAPGQSGRLNAAGTALEAYTPVAGGDFAPAITSVGDGAATSLEACQTAGLAVPLLKTIPVGAAYDLQNWLLVAGTDATDTDANGNPAHQRPNDFNASTNAKVWVRR